MRLCLNTNRGGLSMKLLSFEANKIKNKRLLSALIIVPVLIVVTIFLARLFTRR